MRLWQIKWQSKDFDENLSLFTNYDEFEYELADKDAHDELFRKYQFGTNNPETLLVEDITEQETLNLGELQDILHEAGYHIPWIAIVSDAVKKSYDNTI